jgi:hypothetical protein
VVQVLPAILQALELFTPVAVVAEVKPPPAPVESAAEGQAELLILLELRQQLILVVAVVVLEILELDLSQAERVVPVSWSYAIPVLFNTSPVGRLLARVTMLYTHLLRLAH